MLWSPDDVGAESFCFSSPFVSSSRAGEGDSGVGVASSNSAALPHCGITQSGASRSVSPETARKPFRLCEPKNKGSFVDS